MNEYKVYSICKACHNEDKWYLNSEASDKHTLINEAKECISRAVTGGYKCEHCLGTDIILSRMSFLAED